MGNVRKQVPNEQNNIIAWHQEGNQRDWYDLCNIRGWVCHSKITARKTVIRPAFYLGLTFNAT